MKMRNMRQRRGAVARAAIILFGAGGLNAWTHGANFTASWFSNGVGSWTTAARWSTTPTVPNNTATNSFDAIVNSVGAIVNLNSAISISRFTLNAGTLQGSSTLTTGTLTSWLGGNIAGTGTLNVRGPLNLSTADHGFSKFTVNVGSLSVANWTAGDIHAVDTEGGTFNNAGTFNDSTDSSFNWSVVQTPVFNNLAGARFIKSGTSSVFQEIQAAFNNNGTVSVNSSGLFLDGGGTSSGTFLVAAGSNLAFSDFNQSLSAAGSPVTTLTATSVIKSFAGVEFSKFSSDPGYDHSITNISGKFDSLFTVVDAGELGEVNFKPGAQVSKAIDLGATDWYIYSGKVQFDTAQSPFINMHNLTITGGEIAGSDSRNILGSLTWSGGSISGDGTSSTFMESGGALNGADKFLTNHFLFNQGGGQVAWTAGDIHLHNSWIFNDTTSSWDNSFDGDVINDYLSLSSFFENNGTFIKSSGTGVSNFDSVQFDNNGTVIVQSGTLRLGGGGVHSGTFNISANAVLELASISGGGTNSHTLDAPSSISGPAGSTLRFVDTTVYSNSSINVGPLDVVDSTYFVNALNQDLLGVVAPAAGDFGKVIVDTGGTWTSSSFIQIGASGNGSLIAQNGGVVNADVVDLAVSGSLSSGYVSVSGLNSKLHSNNFLRVGNFGSAQMDIADQAEVSNTQGLVASEFGSAGTITVKDAGSKWLNSDYLAIGLHGNGSMSITNGGLVQSTVGYIAGDTNGVGSVLVSGSGSQWNMASFLSDGTYHDGTLIIQSGGLVSNVNAGIGDVVGGHGYLRVSGGSSQWNTTGFASIGNSGNGTMLVDTGGHVYTSGLGQVGSGTGSTGVATITGSGSRWDMDQQLGVGVGGSGTLVISGGAAVSSKKGPSVTGSGGIIGRFAAGSGTVTVTGVGSRWDMAGIGDDGALNVGFGSLVLTDVAPGGTGLLIVNNGAVVTSTDGFIARGSGATGTAIIGGAGAASASWSMNGALYVGGDSLTPAPGGAGTLIVGTLGTVTAPTSTKIWNNGTILYQHGTFSTGSLTLTGGGKMLLATGNDKVLQTTAINVDAAGGSKLDLSNNKAIVDYAVATPSPADAIRQQIRAAYNNGNWTANGITTSTGESLHGLGYADNSILNLTTFGGITVDPTSVLIKYTYLGDSNLDGQVDIRDLYALASNYNSTGKLWTSGDYNYDGTVNVQDLTLLAKNWQAGVNSPIPGPDIGMLLTNLGFSNVVIPEPTLSVAVALSCLFSRRRRRLQHLITGKSL